MSEQEPTIEAGHVRMSPSCAELFGALAKAQGEMGAAIKDAVSEPGTNRARKYADLASAWEAVRGPLSRHGLALMQPPASVDGRLVTVTTILAHSSGQYMMSEVSADATGLIQKGVQATGSIITYLRRYALMAVCGIAPDDDDDGNASAAAAKARPDRKPEPKRENDPPAPAPVKLDKDGHDLDWKRSQAAFCAALNEIGVKYNDLAAHLEALGEPRPSAMGAAARRKVYADLKAGRLKVTGGAQ